MNLSEVLKSVCKKCHVTVADLARSTGQTPQNLTMKIRRNSVDFEDFCTYMDKLGVRVSFDLTYPNGETGDLPPTDPRARERIAILEQSLDAERRNTAYQKTLHTDMRTALYSLRGCIDMGIKNEDSASRMREYLKKSRLACAKLAHLMDQSIFATGEDEMTEANPIDSEVVKGKRILLVEDNDMNREITRDMLQENGMIVDCVNDGAAAVKRIKTVDPGTYDCVLMDIEMPVMNGIDATRAIRELPNRIRSNVPIVAMTANAFEEDRQRSAEAGMDAYLTKPIDTLKMIHVIASFL